MRVTITTLDAAVYQFANNTIADDIKGIYRGRLINQLNLSRSFSELGSNLVTISLYLINSDKIIPGSVDLWGAVVEVETDAGQSWSGKVTAYESNVDGKLIVTATERTVPELSQYLPDEFINLATVTADVHYSSLKTTIPLVIGGTRASPIAVKGILKSKANGIYYLCVGEIHEIVNIRVGDQTMTLAEAEAAGYAAYTGSASQETEPGIAYVEITDPNLRKNDDGTYVEIGAEVVGLKLGTHTIEECRNGARFLLWLLKTARTGACGWGLGVAEADIELSTFTTAISAVDTAGLKLDGIIYDRKLAQNWINEICRSIRGIYAIGENGKRRLFISTASDASTYTYTKDNIELVRFGVGAYTGRVFNAGRLDYAYNPLTGLFMQAAFFEDTASIADIDEQLFEGQNYLIRDALTAQAILEYTCKRSLVGANKVLFSSRFLPENCRPGLLIILDYPEHGLTGLWKITSLQIGDHVHRIEAEKYSTDIFTVGTPGTAIEWDRDPEIVSPVTPGAPTDLNLSQEVRLAADGTATIVLIGTFTLPTGKYLAASVEYGEGAEPTTWSSRGLIQGNTFEIKPVKPSQLYAVRVKMISSTGHSDYVTATITTQGDTAAPGAPSVVVGNKFFFAQVKVTLADPPDDLAGFKIYRGTSNVAAESEQISSAMSKDGWAEITDYLPTLDTYYYFAKSYDKWGNLSDFSAASNAVQASQILDADILRKLTPADALNTDPYFQDFSAWSSDLADTAANPDNFTTITGGLGGSTGFKSAAGEKLVFGVAHDSLIPYDSTRKYVLTAFMKATGGGSHGLGFAYYDADKELIEQSSSLEYAVAADTTWTQFSKTPGTVPAGTAFISPIVVCNNGEAAEVVLEVQKLRLRELLTSDMLVVNEAVITVAAQIANAIITNAHIANLDAAKITTGTIDAERLSADIATIQQLHVMGKNLIEDPSLLDFPDSFVPTGSDDEYSYGRWTIGADADIPENTSIGSATYLAIATHENEPSVVPVGKGIVITPFAATNRIWLAQRVVVAASTDYAFSAHVLTGNVENAVCPPFQLIIEWYGASGLISQTAAECDDVEGGRFEVSGTSPATATNAILYLLFQPGAPTSPAFYLGVISALQMERSEDGATFWVGREQGTIIADRIFTGILKSLNYGALEGSKFDLFAGTFELGGSESPALSWNGLLLKIKGWIEALAGIIAGFTIEEDSMTAGEGTSAVGISTDIDKAAFWAGAEDPVDAPYRVNHDGTGKIGLLSFTDSVIEHRTYDLNYDPVDPDHTIQTFAIRPNADGWKGAEMIFQDGYAEVGLYIDTTTLIYSLWGGALVKFLPFGGRTQAAPQLKIAGGTSTDYAFVTPSIIEGYLSNLSDKNIKKDFKPVSTLDKLRRLDVSEWSYDEEAIERKAREKEIEESLKTGNKVIVRKAPDFIIDKGHRHIGPTAKEFNELFGVFGGNPNAIGVGDQIGVALRAIQELADIVDKQAARIEALEMALKAEKR